MLQFARHSQWGRLLVLLSLGMLLTLAAVACGDDGDGAGDAPGATSTPTQDQGEGEPTPDDGNGEDSDGADDGEPETELRRFGDLAATASGRITYRFSSDDSEGLSEGTMTYYFQPPDKSRFDLSDEEGEFIVIQAGNVGYFCTSDPTGGSCFTSTTQDEEPFVPFFADFASPEGIQGFLEGFLADIAGEDVEIRRFSQTIAGVDASCFEASGVVEAEAGEFAFCFAKENGLMLLMDGMIEGSGSFRLEATEVGSVSDSDFEPPYEVIETGGDFNFQE